MPERIKPDFLRESLPALQQSTELTPLARQYQAYYGLERPAVQSRLWRFAVADYQLVAQAWWPEQPLGTLVILHGYYDHMGLYRHVLDWGLEMGFAVLACDLPGHGLSSGPRASINEFEEYQAVLDGLLEQAALLDLPQPWHLLGQSTGGAIVLDRLLSRPGQPVPGESILLAPLVRPRSWRWSRLSYAMLRHFVEKIPRTFTDNSGDAAFLEFVQRSDPLQPDILPTAWVGALARWIPRIEAAAASSHSPIIVQGEADMTVDWRHNLSVLQRKFSDPQVFSLPEARHHLANEEEALRRRYFAFLSERLGR
ncbi:alpha/beta hydrolase [Stutzerimonas kirkiae]|uniref:Alpha/beta hydrolase n=1 Tax=Stutzerimonas kirkiae TaxID=2211392 RepID=A0A4Q9R7J6_9GAMM|nr:alpha/beta hydrolase [Stutzerimonas kirkiae]TBU96592.1 alpha/beta hydrolase [Stutzerimonas kirkiae]TBV02125.1 alpha/beta hydrolase [Stutzerimonas kirkiae]TBV08795.1 alpha/beta hydrolase [Stutzerimonas kirkiae]TBV15630.1 alpha/beta hydrolase [Stutzerimonas kirkiae]